MLLLDADFLPNRALTDLLHDPGHYEQLRRVTGYRQGIVLPAFETIDDGEEGKKTALKAITGARWGASWGVWGVPGRRGSRLGCPTLACVLLARTPADPR